MTQRYARVPATVDLAGWQRHAGYKATAGGLEARASSQAGALAELGDLITQACQRAGGQLADGRYDGVTFRYDADNRMLWVAVPDVAHGGHHAYTVRLTADGRPYAPHGGHSGTAAARDALADAVGIAPVPEQAPKLPAMPDEVREMLSTAADALTALGRFGGNLTEAEAGAQSALADLADYVSAQFAVSELDR
jgi:hypothetical protein